MSAAAKCFGSQRTRRESCIDWCGNLKAMSFEGARLSAVPFVSGGSGASALRELALRLKNRGPSVAKASIMTQIYGTAEAVPLQSILSPLAEEPLSPVISWPLKRQGPVSSSVMTRSRTLLCPPRKQPTCTDGRAITARVFRLSKIVSSGKGTGPACFVLPPVHTLSFSTAKQKAPKQVRLPCFGASFKLAHWG